MSKGFKILLIVFLIVLIICAIVNFLLKDSSYETEVNNNEDVLKSSIPEGIKINNEKLDNDGVNLNISFDIYCTKENVSLENVELKIVDSANEVISYILLPINTSLSKGSSLQLSTFVKINYEKDDLKIIYIFD